MNALTKDKQIGVLRKLTNGTPLRAITRDMGVARNTCSSLLLRFGGACQQFLDKEMRDLELRHVECDELFTIVGKQRYNLTDTEKANSRMGRFFVYVALDEDSRLVPTHRVAKEGDKDRTLKFIKRLAACLQFPKPHLADDHDFKKGKYKPIVRISTDGYHPYIPAINEVF